jgi:hypothetical protein
MSTRQAAYERYTSRLTAAAAAHVPLPLAKIISEYARVDESTHFESIIQTMKVRTKRNRMSIQLSCLGGAMYISYHETNNIKYVPQLPLAKDSPVQLFDDTLHLTLAIANVLSDHFDCTPSFMTATYLVDGLYTSFVTTSDKGYWKPERAD